jgi:Ca2+-transporting ATPase
MLLLLVGLRIYLLLGDPQEAAVLAAWCCWSSRFVPGIQTERALQALWDLSSPRAHVLRDGTRDWPRPASS